MPSKGAIEARMPSCDRSRTVTSDLGQFLETLKPRNLHRNLWVSATNAYEILIAPGGLTDKHKFRMRTRNV